MDAHILGCDEYHAHAPPRCCSGACWCRRHAALIDALEGFKVVRDGGDLGQLKLELSWRERAAIVGRILDQRALTENAPDV